LALRKKEECPSNNLFPAEFPTKRCLPEEGRPVAAGGASSKTLPTITALLAQGE
jgi:hypothetical protein